MVELSPVARAVRRSIAMGAMAAVGTTMPAFGQDKPQDQESTLTEVVVTGSRIAQPNLTTTSPVTQVTSEDVKLQGVTRIEDLVASLPQAFASQNSTNSNSSTGVANVSLRNLESKRTLVLIDGRRLSYGDPTNSAGDLNEVPTSMVERVEVLTGGASAVYGSDAVAGVVNFIMKKDFEGVELSGQYGFYSHKNDFTGPGVIPLRQVIANRAATNPAAFALPPNTVNLGYSREASLLVGVGTEDGRGNMTAYATYRRNDAILQRDYDYSACTLGATVAGSFTCGGSGTSFPGRFTDFGGGTGYNLTIDRASTNTFTNFVNARDQYNFGPLNYYQRPDTRYAMGVMGHFELNEHADVYAQFMYSDNRTLGQIAPSGDFFNTTTINCGNPYLAAARVPTSNANPALIPLSTRVGCTPAQIAADAAAVTPDPANTAIMYIGRRNVEGGGRGYDFHNASQRVVTGVRGAISEGWTYDVSTQFSRKTHNEIRTNDFSVRRLTRALDVVSVAGVPTCRSVVNRSDTTCVPYNVFSLGAVTPAALAYVQVPTLQNGVIDQNVVNATVTGDLEQYGWKFPTATHGVQFAVGAEYRRDKMDYQVDDNTASADATGTSGAVLPLSGAIDVKELFMEGRIPLVQDHKGAQQLGIDVAYRFSDYGNSLSTNTYKLGADWAPVEDVRFRASFQRAIRAANIVELFTAQGFNLFDLPGDPCGLAAPNPNATRAKCIASGVPAAVYDDATPGGRRSNLDSPAGQYQFLQGGNPNVKPEESDTFMWASCSPRTSSRA